MSSTGSRNVEAEASSQKCPRHVREGEEEERSTAEGVNGEECRECKHEVDKTETERCNQSLCWCGTGLLENSGGVESLSDVSTIFGR